MPFVETCIYEVKPEKTEEFEALIKEVAAHHRAFPGVLDVRYMKRTHRQADFATAKEGRPPVRLTRVQGAVTYVLYWELEDEEAHGRATKAGLEKYYRRFARCLTTMPRIILGESIE
ncbi:MAG: antibiotic biosynthesis monooxygenase [Firmicutes bacterium]|nr:antibiotic biosynthesis monooxygenase [Bacillota bacterium]